MCSFTLNNGLSLPENENGCQTQEITSENAVSSLSRDKILQDSWSTWVALSRVGSRDFYARHFGSREDPGDDFELVLWDIIYCKPAVSNVISAKKNTENFRIMLHA